MILRETAVSSVTELSIFQIEFVETNERYTNASRTIFITISRNNNFSSMHFPLKRGTDNYEGERSLARGSRDTPLITRD